MSRSSSGDRPLPPGSVVAIELDDIADADAELDLDQAVIERGPPRPEALAAGSELRSRVTVQGQPSDLDLSLIAYLLDLEPVAAGAAGAPGDDDDDTLDDGPTGTYPR